MSNQIIGNTEYNLIKEKAYINGTQENLMRLAEELDKAGISYSGRISDYRSAITVEAADRARTLEIMKGILNAAKVNVPEDNPEKNIIGNAEYRYISNKRYVRGEAEAMLRTADRLTAENISFSGRIKGDTVTLTVSGDETQELVKRYFSEEKNRIENVQSAYFLALSSDTFEDGYYFSEVNTATGEEIAPYRSSFGDISMFVSVDSAVQYAAGADITLSNTAEQLNEWRRIEAEAEAEKGRQLNLSRSREIIKYLPMTEQGYEEHFILREDVIDWIYFNPNGADGEGQFVQTSLYADDFIAAFSARSNTEDYNRLGQSAFIEAIQNGRQTVINADTEEFELFADIFIKSRDNENVIVSSPLVSGNKYDSNFERIINLLENHFEDVRKYKGNHITEASENISVEGHIGTWYVIAAEEIEGRKLFLLEHEKYGDETANIIIDENKNLVMEDVWNGFDDYRDSLEYDDGKQYVSRDFAVELWQNGFTVFMNDRSNELTSRKNDPKNFDLFRDENNNAFYAFNKDIVQQRFLDDTVTLLDGLNDAAIIEAGENDKQIDAAENYAKDMFDDGDCAYRWNDGITEWQNISASIFSGNTEYLYAWLNDLPLELPNLEENRDVSITEALNYLDNYEKQYMNKLLTADELKKGTRIIYNDINWEVAHINNYVLALKNLDSDKQMSSLIVEDWQNTVTRNKVKFIEEISPLGKNVPDENTPLSKQLHELAKRELADYENSLDTAEKAKAAAYELSVKRDILSYIEYDLAEDISDPDVEDACRRLISSGYPLDTFYRDWLKNEYDNRMEAIRMTAVDTFRKEIPQNEYKLEADTKDYVIDGQEGTWSVVNHAEINGRQLFELESDNYGYTSEVGHIIADVDGNVIAENVHNGFENFYLEKARETAHNAGLPFREAVADPEEEFNPYAFDGTMSSEDYELMHKHMREDSFEIYQIKSGEEYHGKRFAGLSELGNAPDIAYYDLVFSGKLSEIDITVENKNDILESIFTKFNTDRPEDFNGHSLSVSDIVVLHKDDTDTAHYVDIAGFNDVPEFLKEKTAAPRKDAFDTAVELINEYVEREFGETANFSNTDHVDLAYTTHEITELPIEVYADLDTFRIVTEYNGKLAEEKTFDSLEDMNGTLGNLDFHELVYVSDDVIDRLTEKDKNASPVGKQPMLKEGDLVTVADRDGIWRVSEISDMQIAFENTDPNSANKIFSHIDFGQHRENLQGTLQYTLVSEREESETDKEITSPMVTNESIVHNAFQRLKDNHDFSPEVVKLLERVEKHIIKYDEENFNSKIFGLPLFQQTYGNVSRVNEKLFGGELRSVIDEVNGYIFEEQIPNSVKGELSERDLSVLREIKAKHDRTNAKEIEQENNVQEQQNVSTAGNDEIAVDNTPVKLNSISNQYNSYLIVQDVSYALDDLLNDTAENYDWKNYAKAFKNVLDSNIHTDVSIPLYKSEAYEILSAAAERKEISADGIAKALSNLELVLQNSHLLNNPEEKIEQISFFDNAPSRKSSDEIGFYSSITEAPQDKKENPTMGNNPHEEYSEKKTVADYTITDKNYGTEGGAKSRFANNVAAIKLMKTIENENRIATPEEQEVLAKYVGWGGIANAFDSRKADWSKEYNELKGLLTDEEYRAAKASTMNAHYTSPTVINAIYSVLDNMGFEGGKILEPAMGIGNFFGAMPENIRANSDLHGVELDSVTGRIAKQLYPSANIQIKGYEDTAFENGSFDVAVGNVPFGGYKLNDKDYNKQNFFIHDYFFAKTLDKVRAGGIVAFVTSKGTLDKESPEVRKYLAERAEFLGAVRLPNNAFKANAGTDVTSDIIFLQKRERPISIENDTPEWVYKDMLPNGIAVNKYFADHPEMILGEMVEGNKLYGNQTDASMCVPIEGADLEEQLAAAIKNIKGTYQKAERENGDVSPVGNDNEIPCPPNAPKYSFIVQDNILYYHKAADTMEKYNAPEKSIEKIKAMAQLRDTIHILLDLQLNNTDGRFDTAISEAQAVLNGQYDNFSEKYGLISNPENRMLFRNDNSYHLIKSLEKLDKDGNFIGKADIFDKITVNPKVIVDRCDNAQDALILSLSEKMCINLEYMSLLTGKSEEEIISELGDKIFQNPQKHMRWESADEYLTGNIRSKLEAAEAAGLTRNAEALRAVMPERIEAADIAVKLGSAWIDPDYIRQFIVETLKPDFVTSKNIEVTYMPATDKWKIEGWRSAYENVLATETYGIVGMNAYEIIEATLNMQKAEVRQRVKDERGNDLRDSKGRYVYETNQQKTMIVQAKQDELKRKFSDWIFSDPDRREKLVDVYNEKFNSVRLREYDGSHLNFVGMSSAITLKEHQKNAVARGLYSNGNTLLAHEVGAGKTFEMIAIAMEGKRLGLHNKSLITAPNGLTEQWGNAFRTLYPNANVLVATEKDFQKENRRDLFAKIATGDWDAVVIGHSQFDMIHLSRERELDVLHTELDRLEEALREMDDGVGRKSFSVKQIEKAIKTYEGKIEKLLAKSPEDDMLCFEKLGIDKIFVDESQAYKNLDTPTKMRNVSGIGSGGSGRSMQLLMKCKYLDELTGGKGCVFASGTPITTMYILKIKIEK